MNYRLILAGSILSMPHIHCMSYSADRTTHNAGLKALIEAQAQQFHQTVEQGQQQVLYPALHQALTQPTQINTYQAPPDTTNIADISKRLDESKKQLSKVKKQKKAAWSSAKVCLYKAGAFGLVACISHAFGNQKEQQKADLYGINTGKLYFLRCLRFQQLKTQIWLAFLSSKISLFMGSVQGILGFKHLFDYFRARRACLQLKVSIEQYKQALQDQPGNIFPDLEQIFG